MISNAEKPAVRDRLREARTRSETLALLTDKLGTSAGAFHFVVSSSSFEVAAEHSNQRIAHRCRLKIFEVRPGLKAAFFYKTSAIPFSRDRFSYGAVTFKTEQEGAEAVDGWIEYLASGFDWNKAPPKLTRALTFDVPE